MKNRVVRFISVALSSMLILGTVGCASKTQGDKSSGVQKVTVWSPDTHSLSVMEKLVNEFNNSEGKKKNIKIVYEVKDSTYNQILDLALQNNEGPDIFGGVTKTMAEKDYIVAIDDVKGGSEYLKEYKNIPEQLKYDGKTYQVPTASQVAGLLYNKDLFKKAGIVDANGEAKPPETFDELCEDAKKITNVSEKKYGIILPMKWGGWFSSDINCPTMSSTGYLEFNPETGKFDYSHHIAAMNMFLKIKQDGSYFPGAEGVDNDSARAQFAAGNIGMKFGFYFDVGVLNDQFPAQCDWGVAPYPVADKNNKYMQRTDIGGKFLINKEAQKHLSDDTIMTVYKFLTDKNMIRELYKTGVEIPYDFNIVSDIQLDNPKKGWKEFSELTAVSAQYTKYPEVDMGSTKTLAARFTDEVWTGKKTPEQVTTEYTKAMNELLDKYFKVHTDEKIQDYMDKNYIKNNKRAN